jgi:transcriptional regulator with XRE-family HTH domain
LAGGAVARSIRPMATRDPIDDGNHGDSGPEREPEGLSVAERLQELGAALGLRQAALARYLDIDPRHFNGLWSGKKRAGLPLIRRIARNSGRSIAWVCGEEAARPQIGTADALGQVVMTANTVTPGVIYFVEGSTHFAAGARVLLDPSDRFAPGQWLLIQAPSGQAPWFGAAVEDAGRRYLIRADGETFVYSAERHAIIGVVVGVLDSPPPIPSAQR